jgi:hypothetical protein
MDPDMVRQQEEAEAAARLRRAAMARASVGRPPESPFSAKVEARDDLARHVPEPPKATPGWGAALRASFFSLVVTALALIAGIMLGVKLGLVAWQSLAIGVVAGYLLGWQTAVAALRKRSAVSLGKALRAPLVPTALILFALVLSMATAALFTDISPTSLSSSFLPSYWITVAIGALIGFTLATIRMHGNLRS